MELMVGKLVAETAARGGKRVKEDIIGIGGVIGTEDRPQTALIETGVVRHERHFAVFHKRKILVYLSLRFCPYFGELRRIVRVKTAQAVDILTKTCIIIGQRANERIERICYLTISDNDDSD